eukprot:Em0004g604a
MPRPFLALVQMEVAGLVAHLVKVMEQVVKVIALSVSIGAIVSSIYDPEGNKIHTVMAVVCVKAGACVLYPVSKGSGHVAGISEPRHVKKLRSWAVRTDDQFTNCISVGPYAPPHDHT